MQAIQELNDKSDGKYDDVLPEVDLKLALHDTKRDPAQGFRGAMRLANRPFSNSGVHAYVGAASSGVTKEVALLSSELGIPQISYSSTAADLSDADRYPLLMRTPPSDAKQGNAIADVVSSFEWSSVATVASDSYYGQSGMRSFRDAAVRRDIDVQLALSFHEHSAVQMGVAVEQIKASGLRIIVAFCDSDDGFELLKQAHMVSLAGNSSDVQWILTDALASNFIPPAELDPDALSGILSFLPSQASTPGYYEFVDSFLAQPNTGTMAADAADAPIADADCSDMRDDGFGVPLLEVQGPDAAQARCVGLNFSTFHRSGSDINSYTPMTYDAILTLAHGLHALIESNGGADRSAFLTELDAAGTIAEDPSGERRRAFGQQLFDQMISVSFEGATGNVRFNPGEDITNLEGVVQANHWRGDRAGMGSYTILQYPVFSDSLELEAVGNWTADGNLVAVSNDITWATRDGKRPASRMCGTDGTLCFQWFGDARPFCDLNTSRCVPTPVHDCVSTLPVNPQNLTTYPSLELPEDGWPAETAASMCEPFLPPDSNVCCRPKDEAATDWLKATFANDERLFGQCDNCLESMKRWACQQVCDERNMRFLPMALLDGNENTPVEEGVTGQMCNSYCDTLYLSCKSVEWKDTIEFIYSGSAHDWASVDDASDESDGAAVVDNSAPAEKFCADVLSVKVLPMQCSTSSAAAGCRAMPDAHVSPTVDHYFHESRICTPKTGQTEVFCLSSNVHSELGLVCMMLCLALVLAAVISEFLHGLHGKCRDLLPNATITLILGVILGVLIEFVIAPYEQEHRGTHHSSDFAQFNKEIFSFLLLPIIIFSSSFNMEHTGMMFFTLRLPRIMFFAFFGTLIALLFTGGLVLFLDSQIGFFRDPISVSEAMMFGALISAVDPVSTLAAFQSLGVEPRIYALIYGEAILNDAVAIVAFKVFSTIAEGFSVTAAVYQTAYIGLGSVAVGFAAGLVCTFLFKYHGTPPAGAYKESLAVKVKSWHRKRKLEATTAPTSDDDKNGAGTEAESPPSSPSSGPLSRPHVVHGEELEHHATHDAMIFFFASLSCYYIAEWLHCSGIITALVAGLICNRYAIENLSAEARGFSRNTYTIMSEMCDELIMLSIGVSFVTYIRVFPLYFSVIATVLVVMSRGISVFPLATIWNAGVKRKAKQQQQVAGSTYSLEESLMPKQHCLMMFAGGLRGAVALALVMGMPSSKVDVFASATLFIIMVTNVILGGATTNVINFLGVHSKQAGNMTDEDTDFTPSEEVAVLHWYDIEKKFVPFLRLDVDLEKREEQQRERKKILKEGDGDEAWRVKTEQVLTNRGSADSARASQRENRTPMRESDFDSMSETPTAPAGGGEAAAAGAPEQDPETSNAEAEARSTAALDLLMPMPDDNADGGGGEGGGVRLGESESVDNPLEGRVDEA